MFWASPIRIAIKAKIGMKYVKQVAAKLIMAKIK